VCSSDLRNPSSLLHWTKRLIAVRKNYKAFGRGSIKFLEPGNRKILAYVREWQGDIILCVVNLSRTAQPVELDLSAFKGRVPVELLGRAAFPPIGDLPYLLTFPGYGTYGFRLATDVEVPYWHENLLARPELPVLVLTEGWLTFSGGRASARTVRGAISAATQEQLQHKVLAPYLASKRWFATRGHRITGIEILEQGEWNMAQGSWLLTILQVHCEDLAPQLYFLPLAIYWEEAAGEQKIQALAPWTLARVRQKERTGILYGAFGDDLFCRALVQGMGQNLDLPIGKGKIEFRAGSVFQQLASGLDAPVRHPALEQSNTAVYFGDQLFLKGYRRLQVGTNPELEVGRFLTEQSPYPHIVPVAGGVELRRADGQTLTLVLLQAYVENQGKGWNFAVDYLERFLAEQLAAPLPALAPQTQASTPSPHGYFLVLMDVLGRRTAELHRAFCRSTGNPAFESEPITAEDLAAWSGHLHDVAVATLDELERRRDTLSAEVRATADRLLSLRPGLLDRIAPSALAGISAAKMRYHGDYHLGQVLLVENDFIITDFEGESARTMEERRGKHSPLRDVAGMLRSFSYVSAVAAMRVTTERPADRQRLGPLLAAWEQETREVFLRGYANAMSDCPALPAESGAAARLIEFFMIEKTLYELRSEMDKRPDWLPFPLVSLLGILGQSQ
jgi:maltose alpha-D-glucosyltransferase/alpha-amylase